MFSNWKKSRAIKKYLKFLPRDLAARYGLSDFYTVGQVKRTIEELKYPQTFVGYAYILFLSQDEAVNALGDSKEHETIRNEIALKFFNGDNDFQLVPLSKRAIGNVGHSSMGPTSEAFHD